MIAETTVVDKWTYLVGVIMLLAAWCGIYLWRQDLHRRMLLVSVLLIPAAPLGQYFFLQDYWRPPVLFPILVQGRLYGGLVDLIFAFVMGGMAAAAYPLIFNLHPMRGSHKGSAWVGGAFVVLEGLSVGLLTPVWHLNSIFSSSAGFVLSAIVTVVVRRDLWRVSIGSGIFCGLALAGAEGVLSFVVPLYLSRYWLLFHSPWGILILGRVPLTEAIWGFTFGLAVGPLYDAVYGSVLAAKKSA